jgi:hypothetical protein
MKSAVASLGMCILGAAFATQANASCSYFQPKATPSSWQEQRSGQVHAQLIANVVQQVATQGADNNSVVGLWKFKFVADGNGLAGPPDGTPIDSGYVTWHDDGTELMNSGRSPATGSFCMGLWERVGPSTYKLNHVALVWQYAPDVAPTGPGTGGAIYIGPAQVLEEVTLSPKGDRYE